MRVYQALTSSGAWLEEKVMCKDQEQCSSECIIEYNEDLIDPIKTKLESLLMLQIIGAAIVDVLAIKYRRLAHLMPYLELLTRLTASLIPNVASQSTSNVQYFYMLCIAVLAFYTYHKIQIVLYIGAGLYLMIGEKYMVYN